MNVLSIDVGIKNLAFCLFFVHQNKYEINQWEIIDLSDSKKKCKEKKKNGDICNKNAKFFKKEKFYCKIHAKNKQYKIPTNNMKIPIVKRLVFSDLKKLSNKLGIEFHKKIKKKELLPTVLEEIEQKYFSFFNTINSSKSHAKLQVR